jgi:micrococcal nuclease
MKGRSSGESAVLVLLSLLKRTGLFRGRRGLYLLVVLAFSLIPLYFKTELTGGSEYVVKGVIDGDTVILQGVDTPLRYLEIDTPEILTDESPGDPISQEARDLNESLVYGKRVKLEFDKEKYDQYGRMLAYVFVDGVFVNQEMVRNGLARALVIRPNDKYADLIREAENQAKRERKGIWGNIDKINPPPENERFLIKPSQAARYNGQRVVVRGKIVDSRKSRKVVVLDMENELDVVVFSGDLENFTFFGIAPERYYVGRPVEVIGRVKMYKGKPEIIVSHPISIRSLE